MTDQQTSKKTPTLNIFAKILSSDGTTKIGAQLGVAFSHKEGNGLNIILDGQPIPINGRLELIAFPPKS